MEVHTNALQCGIVDFSFSDLLKPTYGRLVKIFSYIINFVRFRESQTAVIDEHFNKSETTKARIETLYGENQDMEARLQEMRRERRAMEQQFKEKTKRNDELKERLRQLKYGQEKIVERLDNAKAERGRLTSTLEDKTARYLGARQECEKLRPYVTQSPAVLESQLTELSAHLSRDRSQIDGLEKRTRALQTSTDTFSIVMNDVNSCVKVLEEVSNELHKEDEENLKASKRRDALGERSNNVREVEHTEALLQRQLKRWTDRTESVRQTSREKAQAAKEKMEELRAVHRQLTEERTDRQKEMERKRVKMEQTEKKVGRMFTLALRLGSAGIDLLTINRWPILKRTLRMRSTLHMMNSSKSTRISNCTLPRWNNQYPDEVKQTQIRQDNLKQIGYGIVFSYFFSASRHSLP